MRSMVIILDIMDGVRKYPTLPMGGALHFSPT